MSGGRIECRVLSRADIEGSRDIDRTECVDHIYYLRDGALGLKQDHCDVPDWSSSRKQEWIADLVRIHDGGGRVFGAYRGATMVGISALDHRPVRTGPRRLNLSVLYVSNGYRGQGTGRTLVHLVAQEARRRGATSLYISATPSENTIRIYMGLGCVLADPPDPDLFAREPEDIHLVLPPASWDWPPLTSMILRRTGGQQHPTCAPQEWVLVAARSVA
jgi:GNAT superfamily N-acetyltransferase